MRAALEQWARALAAEHDDIRAIGVFGSYARGDAGVGSDLDVVMIVAEAEAPWGSRAASWDTTSLPVPVDLIVYTVDEWHALDRDSRFSKMIIEETQWVAGPSGPPPASRTLSP